MLTGSEEPEHALPAAINARFKTYAVCIPCNRWAGKHVDKPWLGDLFVRHLRFVHQIPDRDGNTMTHDPLLAGTTEDGRRVRLGGDGRPELLNSPIRHDEERGEFHISAPDEETLDRMIDRVLNRAGKRRNEVELGEPKVIADRPLVQAAAQIYPGQWERMAAKMTLALLADEMPQSWRSGESAERLRERMRDLDRKAADVALLSPEAFQGFAPAPCSVLVVTDRGGAPECHVSLLGQFKIALPLAEDLRGVDQAWVSDAHQPARSCAGPLAQVVAARLGLAGAVSPHRAARGRLS